MPALVEAARERSNDMAKTGHFAHDRIGGCPTEFTCVLDRQGVPYAYAGENIAWNNWSWSSTAEHAVTAWKNSPPHFENIMNCHYTQFGTGVAQSADGKIWYTMIFEGNARLLDRAPTRHPSLRRPLRAGVFVDARSLNRADLRSPEPSPPALSRHA